MGLFDSLFGTKKEPEAPKKKSSAPAADKLREDVGHKAEQGINPEIMAAIAASLNCVTEDVDAAVIAGIAAAIHHARSGGVVALKIKHSTEAWKTYGRQKIMDGRQSL